MTRITFFVPDEKGTLALRTEGNKRYFAQSSKPSLSRVMSENKMNVIIYQIDDKLMKKDTLKELKRSQSELSLMLVNDDRDNHKNMSTSCIIM